MTQDLMHGFKIGAYVVKPGSGKITGPTGSQHVQPKVIEVLLCLSAHPGEVVNRESLHQEVWGTMIVSDDALTRCISELRHAFNDLRGNPEYIQTLPKRGYRLLQPVVTEEGSAPKPDSSDNADTLGVVEQPFGGFHPEPGTVWIADAALEGPTVLTKQPSESRVYEMNFAPRMSAEEVITSIDKVSQQTIELENGAKTISSDLDVEPLEYAEKSITARISGGLNRNVYKLTFVVNTSLGNVVEADGLLIVYDS